MSKYYIISILGIAISLQCKAQRIDSLIHLGNTYRENGNHQQAIIEYRKALRVEKNSSLVNFEIAFTYLSNKEYRKSVRYCNRILKSKSEKILDAIILKGSALDYLGKSKKSIRLYTSAIDQFPNSYLLHYNLGITYYNNNQLHNAKEYLVKAIGINKLQPDSHFLLGTIMNDLGSRAESMISLYFFLMLEPNTDRSIEAYRMLIDLWKQNIVIDSSSHNRLQITINPKTGFSSHNSIDILVSSIYANSIRNNQLKKNDYELITSNTSSLFYLLGSYKGTSNGIWSSFYISFFNDLFNANQVEPFCYYISSTCDDAIINSWLEANRDKIELFSEWANNWLMR